MFDPITPPQTKYRIINHEIPHFATLIHKQTHTLNRNKINNKKSKHNNNNKMTPQQAKQKKQQNITKKRNIQPPPAKQIKHKCKQNKTKYEPKQNNQTKNIK